MIKNINHTPKKSTTKKESVGDSLVVTEQNIESFAKKITSQLHPGDILALHGTLSAGKTTLTKAILSAMKYKGKVSSPTFVIERRYPVNINNIKEVLHLDLYRLNDEALKFFDWDEYLENHNQLTIIEWPLRAEPFLPKKTKKVFINILSETERQIELGEGLTNES